LFIWPVIPEITPGLAGSHTGVLLACYFVGTVGHVGISVGVPLGIAVLRLFASAVIKSPKVLCFDRPLMDPA